jgi:hypothetical protein
VPTDGAAAVPADAPPPPGPSAGDADIVDGEAVDVTPEKPQQCDGFHEEMGRCRLFAAHGGPHKSKDGVWPR